MIFWRHTSCLSCALIFVSLCFAAFVSTTKIAHAQSVVLQQPVDGPISDTMRFRSSHPVSGEPRYHYGIDIAVPSGTPVRSTGTLVSCSNSGGGGGIIAVVDHGCCVIERFMHLESCGGGNIISDNTGGSTGPHLHWEVRIKGVNVNPTAAVGQNLCDEAVQNSLIANAYTIIPSPPNGGGGGSTGACTAPRPEQQPVDEVTYIPPGGVNPVTGVPTPITGPGQIITVGTDGRVTVTPAPGFYTPVSPLPPSVTTGFTQPTTTDNPVTGCSTDTWTAMVNQSVLQTRREMLMNQRYIAKADSVLAYACIEPQLANVGRSMGVFSENTEWANADIPILNGLNVRTSVSMGPASLDGAISGSALSLANSFIRSMFFHDYLGGTAGESELPPLADAGAGTDDIVSMQESATCGMMNRVWQMAKCQNVTDGVAFPRFEDLIGNDPRIYPRIYRCNDSGITQDMIDVARGANVAFDPIETHFSILNPALVGSDQRCAPPISTGVVIERRFGLGRISIPRNYDDAICPTPGCSYQNPALGGLGTCE